MKFAFATAILKIETLRMRRRFARVFMYAPCNDQSKSQCNLFRATSPAGHRLNEREERKKPGGGGGRGSTNPSF